jgi:C-terminal processing protease CtpA/Prc
LTHDASFSAADVFAMLMADLPHVTIIGEPTNGIFSNMLERKLPNGWKYTLSHQVYYSSDKTCYEGKGIPVDIKLLNKRADLEKGVDPLIIKALEVLSAK